jgi:hypothetical protein
MHARTVATLAQLDKANWFVSVGVKDTDAAIVLSSWREAIEHCSSLEWENLCLEAANQYRERLLERSKNRFKKWNKIVEAIKGASIDLVERKIRAVCTEHALPKVFVDTVEWDICHVCLEAEYADVYPPGFYASQAYWYVKGHFPCGWQGHFPEGKLIVF